MSIEITHNGIRISEIINGYRISELYQGYSKAQAIKLFKNKYY